MHQSSSSVSHEQEQEQEPPFKNNNKKLVIIIAGPTAIGKSKVAAKLCSNASEITHYYSINNNNHCFSCKEGNVISADSVQAYKGVQIGSNKPTVKEREITPHHLIDIVDSTSVCEYNAADWMKDAMFVIDSLTSPNTAIVKDESNNESDETQKRKFEIRKQLFNRTQKDGKNNANEPTLPVVVGGTMMYLQWLVHGRPDAMKPSRQAVKKAVDVITKFQSGNNNTNNSNEGSMEKWNAAISYASSLGPVFAKRVSTLSESDWYRLRRTLEVAYTVMEEESEEEKELTIETLYNGQREGGMLSTGSHYDVRCFFLCPSSRMAHTAVVDSRCEDMIIRGLLKETANLRLSGQLPTSGQPARAIGYRQTIEYLEKTTITTINNNNNEEKDSVRIPRDITVKEEFNAYLDEFKAATRRYAKKQMQWFRKDENFIFIPVDLDHSSTVRLDEATNSIQQMCTLKRDEFEKELRTVKDSKDQLSISAKTKLLNEQQGKKMKFYLPKRHKLVEGSNVYSKVLAEADECIQSISNSKEEEKGS